MIPRRYIGGMEVVSVLLFSVLANVLLDVHLDFAATIDWGESIRVICLTLGSALFYSTTTEYRRLSEYALLEHASETSSAAKARNTVDMRYEEFLRPESGLLSLRLACAGLLVAVFVLATPFASLIGGGD